MGKKRNRTTKTSKGERPSISRMTTKLVRSTRDMIDVAINQLDAWKAGKNPWIVVAGDTTRERFKRVRANTVYGNPKRSNSTGSFDDD